MNKQTLPETEAQRLRQLRKFSLDELRNRATALHASGWPLRAIGEPVNAPRSTVHSWVIRSAPTEQPEDAPLPLPTSNRADAFRPRPVTSTSLHIKTLTPQVSPDDLKKIQALAPDARRCRAGTPSTSRYHTARRELDQIVTELHARGVPISHLARAANVTYRAMSVRLQEAANR